MCAKPSSILGARGRAVERRPTPEAVSHLKARSSCWRSCRDSRIGATAEFALQIALGRLCRPRKAGSRRNRTGPSSRTRIVRELGEDPEAIYHAIALAQLRMLLANIIRRGNSLSECLSIAQKRRRSKCDATGISSARLGADLHRYAGVGAPVSRRTDKELRFKEASFPGSPVRRRRSCGLLPRRQVNDTVVIGLPRTGGADQGSVAASAQQLSHPFSIAVAISNTLFLDTFLRECDNAIDQAKAIVALYEDHGVFAIRTGRCVGAEPLRSGPSHCPRE